MHRAMIGAALLSIGALGPAQAQQPALAMPAPGADGRAGTARFEAFYGPLMVARMTVRSSESSRDYAARMHFESVGALELFRSARMEARVQGRVQRGRFAPTSYVGDMVAGERAVRVEMRYANGQPRLVSLSPAEAREPWSLDPASQGGLPDPLTVFYGLYRPVPESELCNSAQDFFDGRHRVHLRTGRARVQGSAARCSGRYERRAGYSPDEMRERTGYDFTVSYTQGHDGLWHLTGVRAQTLLGAVRLRRVAR